MIDLNNITSYRENNRIEAKKALGGLPHSIWETYSAFANAIGGIILMGVEEYSDKSLHPVDLPAPEALVREFWEIANDPKRVSANILTEGDVSIEVVDGKHIIAVRVPRANRLDKPVYLDGDPMTGSYRRNGEGDYRCSPEEVQAMLRDAAVRTQDMRVLDDMGPDVLDPDTLRRYRLRMKRLRPGHAWEALEDGEFLERLGATGRGEDGALHPTAAGLIMFGHERDILRQFPFYSLEYRERMEEGPDWTARITSSSGGWSGNLYDFYARVYDRIAQSVPDSPAPEGDGPVCRALREALANCVVNADYCGQLGLVILKERDRAVFSNPGSFRIDIEAAKSGGVSDPRNAALTRMFSQVSTGKSDGSGLPSIYATWKARGWTPPMLLESYGPDRITLCLSFEKADGDTVEAGVRDRRVTQLQKQAVIDYLTEHIQVTSAELSAMLEVGRDRTRRVLGLLIDDGIVIAEGSGRSRVYRLKA